MRCTRNAVYAMRNGGSNPSLSALGKDAKALIYFHQTTEMNQHMQFLLQKRDTIWDKD